MDDPPHPPDNAEHGDAPSQPQPTHGTGSPKLNRQSAVPHPRSRPEFSLIIVSF